MNGPVTQVEGRVHGPEGEPVEGAMVSVVEGSVPMPEIALCTGADGRFHHGLPGGRFTFRAVDAAGRRSGLAHVEVVAGQGTVQVPIVLAPIP